MDRNIHRTGADSWLIREHRRLLESRGVLVTSTILTLSITLVSLLVSLAVYAALDIDVSEHPVAIMMPIILPLVTALPINMVINRLVSNLIAREAENEQQQQRLHALAREAARQRVAAEAASHAKSALLANMSHELRTPLNAIIGFSDLFGSDRVQEMPADKARQYAQDINLAGRHLLSLINDLLELARIEKGGRSFEPETVDVQAKIDETVRIMRTQADEGQVRLRQEGIGAEITAWTDDRALRQILLNLIGNAIKFTPADGLVAIKARKAGGETVISVSDTGVGIPAEELEAVFEPFRQVDNSMTRRKTGSGLGLALVRTMVEQQGGLVAVESTEGQGTTFTVRLPSGPEQLAQAAE